MSVGVSNSHKSMLARINCRVCQRGKKNPVEEIKKGTAESSWVGEQEKRNAE